MSTVTFGLAMAVAKLNKEMRASPWKIIIKNQQQKPLTPSVKLNQRIQSLIILNAENKLGHLTLTTSTKTPFLFTGKQKNKYLIIRFPGYELPPNVLK